METKTAPGVKRCSACALLKPLSEFHRRGGAHQAWCKGCKRAYDAPYHVQRSPVRVVQKRERRQTFRAWMRELKSSQPCTDCGGLFHSAAMTFDHVPGTTKRSDISTLLTGGYRKVLLEEMAKCELVCANCHAVRTFLRRGKADGASSAAQGSPHPIALG